MKAVYSDSRRRFTLTAQGGEHFASSCQSQPNYRRVSLSLLRDYRRGGLERSQFIERLVLPRSRRVALLRVQSPDLTLAQHYFERE